MTDTPPPEDPRDALQARIDAMKAKRDSQKTAERAENNGEAGKGLGVAWRVSTELVVGVLVGGVVGHFLDNQFGSAPWLLILGLFFGSAAGVLNSYRTMIRLSDQDRDA